MPYADRERRLEYLRRYQYERVGKHAAARRAERAAYREDNKIEIAAKKKVSSREYNQKYYLKNKEKELARNKIFAASNRDRLLENKKINHRKNSDKEREQKKNWYYENQAERIAYTKQWTKNNYERARASQKVSMHNRRAKIRNDGGKLSRGLESRLKKLQRGLCAICRRALASSYHLDHIMPIALGGRNVDNNIQLLCAPCNQSKRAKHPIDFMQMKGFLC